MTRALLLAGHGSTHDPLAGAPVRDHAARIRELGLFNDVRAAFWKEAPFLSGALAAIACDDVHVVPMFLAEGWYTRRVVPRELGIDRALTMRDGQRIHYHRPIGAHPRIPRLVHALACRTLAEAGVEAQDATLAIIGHGTRRISGSGETVERVTAALRQRGFADVAFGFLDQDPRLEHALEWPATRHTVVVPFLLAEGWHTRVTIPERLDLLRAATGGRVVFHVTPPVGTHPLVPRIILDLAGVRAAGAARPDGALPFTV